MNILLMVKIPSHLQTYDDDKFATTYHLSINLRLISIIYKHWRYFSDTVSNGYNVDFSVRSYNCKIDKVTS